MNSGRVLLALVLSALTSVAVAAQLQTHQQKLSYALGMETGAAFKEHQVAVKPDFFVEGFHAGLSGNHQLLTQKQAKQLIHEFQQGEIKKMQQQEKKMGASNLEAADKFLAENKDKPGVVTTASGLQYKVLEKGDGDKPTAKDTVKVDYEGKLIDGKVFDSSYKRGEPASFPVGAVIPGWTEALQLMHKGGTWELYIPPKLAYGSHGVPGVIPPDSLLIFKVHLIDIKK